MMVEPQSRTLSNKTTFRACAWIKTVLFLRWLRNPWRAIETAVLPDLYPRDENRLIFATDEIS